MKNQIPYYLLLCFIATISSCSCHHSNGDILGNEPEDLKRVVSGVYDIPEPIVQSSPAEKQSLELSDKEKVIGFGVSPIAPVAAVLTDEGSGKQQLKLWKLDQKEFADTYTFPNSVVPTEVCWLPTGKSLFVVGKEGQEFHIYKLTKDGSDWVLKSIYKSENEIVRLIACPRPFVVGSEKKGEKYTQFYAYRLFFGLANGAQTHRICSVTESGKRFYQVIGPKETINHFKDEDADPSSLVAKNALPIAFHPAGDVLLWQGNDFFVSSYSNLFWSDKMTVFNESKIKNGSIVPTPNGIGFLHWNKDKAGVGVYVISKHKEENQASNFKFKSLPLSVADGKGVVGVTNSNGKDVLNYVPIQIPLADVTNAWMYTEKTEQLDLLTKNEGLFRGLKNTQLYELYDSESYYCNSYSRSTSTRPYLITTDIFWELFGAAYEGLFILKERTEAMPNFWKFVEHANAYFSQNKPDSKWTAAFAALKNLNETTALADTSQEGKQKSKASSSNPETQKMIDESSATSDIADNEKFSFDELKPRGHYTSSPEMQNYFKGFKYFTTVLSKAENLSELNLLPNEIKKEAKNWIDSYVGFISSSRSPMVFKDINNSVPKYCKYPNTESKIFPLSWGFDNEVLYSTVYHDHVPAEFQVAGPGGKRLLPSGIDLAAALGDGFAESILESDYRSYPPLRKVIQNLKDNFTKNGKVGKSSDNLYDRWINALATQWCDNCAFCQRQSRSKDMAN